MFRENGIYARKYFYPLTSEQECYMERYNTENLFNARYLAKNILVLPFYEGISKEDLEYIIFIVKGY